MSKLVTMISFKEAFDQVMSTSGDFGTEQVSIQDAVGRVLAEDIFTDRDYPPFNRSTKDGIAINYDAIENGRNKFEIKGVVAAGMPATQLMDQEACVEIMTGAVIPYDADTVIMYEHVKIDHGIAELMKQPIKGQNIHVKGSDETRNALVLKRGTRVTAAEAGLLATVGKQEIAVKSRPQISVISTGNELVDVDQDPLPHQIRRSNSYSLHASLATEGINPLLLHLPDDPDIIRQRLRIAVQEMDVLLLSGGVSKGKYDYIPQVLTELGVENKFHGVLQRPGKPFWFGIHPNIGTIIFSFPGNPVSTFVNYHVYFKNWFKKSMGQEVVLLNVLLKDQIKIEGDLTRFLRVSTHWEGGKLMASLITANGSGDLISLVNTDGFVKLDPREEPYRSNEAVPFIPTRTID